MFILYSDIFFTQGTNLLTIASASYSLYKVFIYIYRSTPSTKTGQIDLFYCPGHKILISIFTQKNPGRKSPGY